MGQISHFLLQMNHICICIAIHAITKQASTVGTVKADFSAATVLCFALVHPVIKVNLWKRNLGRASRLHIRHAQGLMGICDVLTSIDLVSSWKLIRESDAPLLAGSGKCGGKRH